MYLNIVIHFLAYTNDILVVSQEVTAMAKFINTEIWSICLRRQISTHTFSLLVLLRSLEMFVWIRVWEKQFIFSSRLEFTL